MIRVYRLGRGGAAVPSMWDKGYGDGAAACRWLAYHAAGCRPVRLRLDATPRLGLAIPGAAAGRPLVLARPREAASIYYYALSPADLAAWAANVRDWLAR